MPDLFVLNYLLNTLGAENRLAEWKAFKRDQIEGIDLSRGDLENRDLSGYDLSGVNLSGARLYNANLRGADLCGANLAYADARRADLAGAFLTEADLSAAILESANAVDTDFQNARMNGCRLRGAHLVGAILVGADLENANLSGANLKFADLTGARLKAVNVEEADLTNCRIDPQAAAGFVHFDRAIQGDARDKPRRRAPRPDPVAANAPHKVLEIDRGASPEAITKAYRKKVIQCHPDKVRHLSEPLQQAAREEFEHIQRAYEALSEGDVQADGETPARDYLLHELLELARTNPNNDRVHCNLGLKFFAEGNTEHAIEAYERALEINPGNPLAAHNLKIARLTQTLGSEKGS
jgi:uncharacterized protein YjbI with pentapeptide repeats